MEQLINKDTLVAELEKRTDELYDLLPDASKVENGMITISEACNTGKYTALESFKKYIDTLEVKEVDLENEITLWANAIPEIRLDDVEKLAKYFFELGLKAQKGE